LNIYFGRSDAMHLVVDAGRSDLVVDAGRSEFTFDSAKLLGTSESPGERVEDGSIAIKQADADEPRRHIIAAVTKQHAEKVGLVLAVDRVEIILVHLVSRL
jgi:hypothetical protein